MKEGRWQSFEGWAKELFESYNQEDILLPEAVEQNLSSEEWGAIQSVHDNWDYVDRYLKDCEVICKVDLSYLKETYLK